MPSDLSIEIQPRDLLILRSLFESRIMTSRHISILHFDGNDETAKKRIGKLKAAKLLGEKERRVVNERSILFLTKKAFAILEANGILQAYPALSLTSLEKRTQVADATIRHELEVLDVKTAICSAISKTRNLAIEEFTTWPALSAFEATIRSERLQRNVKPDGFIQIGEDDGEGKWGYSFFLELDRSTETQEVLALKAACYAEYYRSGGFALRNRGSRTEFDKFPFRVLFVLQNAERRNNTTESLLQNNPPIRTQVYLSTLEEVKTDPLGAIWIRPVDFKAVTDGTAFDTSRECAPRGYKRQTEREILVEKSVKKLSLFE